MSASDRKTVRVGVIGGGLMGKEAASAFGRWFALQEVPVDGLEVAVVGCPRESGTGDLDRRWLDFPQMEPHPARPQSRGSLRHRSNAIISHFRFGSPFPEQIERGPSP